MKRTALLASVLTMTFGANFAAAQATPFVGVVTGDDVYVRSGPSQSYYDIAKANEGDIVRVVDLMHSWYVIEAPEGTYSYIAKQYVEVAGDGETGTVTGNRVRVRAPSKAGPTIEQSYKSQLKLDRGATVEVLGEAGSFYKIVPPQGAMAYIHSDYVREATAGDIAAARQVDADPAVRDAAEEAAETVADRTADVGQASVTDATAGQRTTATQPAAEVDAADARPTTRVDAAEVDAPATATGETFRRDAATVDTPTAHAETARTDIAAPRPAAAETPREPSADVRPSTRTRSTSTAGNTITATGTSDAYAGRTDPTPPTAATEPIVEPTPAPNLAQVQPTESTRVADAAEAIETADLAAAAPADDRDVDQRLASLEAEFAEISNQPLNEQPIERMLRRYRALKGTNQLDEQATVLVDTRIELLEARADLQDTLAELAEVRRQATRDKPMMTSYDAMGRLVSSTLYTGERLPLLYRLVDPLTGLTIGYVEPEQEVELTPLLGRVVGVTGETRFDPGLKLKVIKVDQADVLTAAQ